MTLPALLRTVFPLTALAAALVAPLASAQSTQAPLTGQMLGDRAAPAAAVQSAPPLVTVDVSAAQPAPPPPPPAYPPAAAAAAARPQHGDSVRNLLRLQASGQQAGPRLPILGDQATASYARYLKSFEHDIPDFFDPDVGRSSNRSSSSR